MKTRKTKKRNIIRRAVAFLLCMTMVLGLGMQDVIEQVYAEEAIPVIEQEAATEEAGELTTEGAAPEENAETAEEPDESVGEAEEQPANSTPSQPADAEENTKTDVPSAPAENAGSEEGEKQNPSAPAEDGQSGSDSETSAETNPGGNTGNEITAPTEDGNTVTNPDETTGEDTEDDAAVSDEEEETAEPEEDQEPAEEEAQVYDKEETVGNVTIHVYAEAGVLPENAELSVTPIEKKEITEDMSEEEKAEAEEINAQYEETEQKLKEDVESETEAAMDDAAVNAVNTISAENAETDETAGKTLEGFLAYDISFLVKDENGEKAEIEPEGEVKVSFEFDEAVIPEGVSEDAEVAVKHLKEDENAEGGIVVEDVTENAEVTINESAAVEAMSLTTDSFSTFVITWTVGPWYAETNFEVRFHYVYVDGNDVTEIPEDEYAPEVELELEENQTYDLSQYAPETIEGKSGGYYTFSDIIRVDNQTNGTEIKELKTKSEGLISTTYKVNYVTAQNEEKDWLSSEWGGKTKGHIYFIYEKSDALLFIKDNIMEEGTFQAVYNGEGTVTSYTWSKCSKESGTYADVEKVNYEGGASNLSDDGSALYPAYDEGARQWYKVKVTLENGKTIESAALQVPYYDELQNGSFETPQVTGNSSNMQYGNQEYLNEGGVWQSTGEVYNDYYDKDVALEIVHEGRPDGDNAYSWYKDWDSAAVDGTQFAELNCQAAGALYQDVLTMEGTPLYYSLYHRARGNEKNSAPEYDTMYLVIMPTSKAVEEELTTQDKLEEYLQNVGSTIGTEFIQIGQNVEHNEENAGDGIRIVRITSNDQAWQYVFGSYIPTSSLTRFFFVAGWTDADAGSGKAPTQGNFLDKVGFSQDLPEVQDDQFTIRIQKNFEGLDAQHIDEVRKSIQFKLSAIDNNRQQNLTDDELVNLFGKAYITGKDMTYANGSISWVLPNRSIDPNASYTVTVEEVGADVDGYVMNTSVKTSVTVGDGEPVESSAAEIENLRGKTMAQITFTNTYDRSDNKTVNFTKVWDDGDDQFGTRPESLEVTLKATVSINGTTRELTGEELGGVELTQTLNAPDWSTSWEVPVYYYPEDGSEKIAIDYTVEEGENTSDYEYEASEIVEGDPDKYVEQFDANSITEEADVSTQNGINSISNSAVATAPVQDQNDDFGAPSHHKYITYDAQTGEYTLNLNVTGKKGEAPGVDVLFIIDRSGSMGTKPSWVWGGTYYNLLPTVKDVLTKKGGVIDQILGTEGNNNRVAYISFSDKNGTSSSSWYDADSSWDGNGTPYNPSLKQRIKNLTANGGTNWTYAMMKANELLAGRGNTENDVVVIFMSDGAPTYSMEYSYGSYREYGYDGSTTFPEYRTEAVKVVNNSSALKNAQFYSVYLEDNVYSGMNSFNDALQIPHHALVDGTDLQSGLDEILDQVIPEYKNVTITDVLSEYVEFAEDPQIKVTKTVGNHTTELPKDEYKLTPGDNSVEVTLLNGGALEDGATYTVSFKVKPSDKANDEYATNGYNAEGDPGTGPTSAGKKGFYSNNSGLTKVSYQIEGEKEIKSASYERPVVQVTTHTLSYEKRWNHPDNVDTPNQDVTLKVTYTNGEEREIILKASEGWKYTETVSQNVKIDSIKEVSLNPDYKPDYFISSDGTKATVTNNYYKAAVDSFTVIKEWNDKGYEDQRPESVSVALYQSANGGESSQYGEIVELTKDNSWKHTWNTLPQTSDDGTESFTYEVREVNSPEHYTSNIGSADWTDGGKKVTVTITNTYDENCADESYYIANVLQTDQVTLIKTWDDDYNNQGIRPDNLNITLNNGTDSKVYQLNSDDALGDSSDVWRKTVTVVARKDAQYSAKENLSNNNYLQIDMDQGGRDGNYWFSFTNAVQTKSITVNKVWNDGGDVQGRSETITLELQYKVGDAWVRFTDITLSQDKDWTATVDGLLITNEYQVVEKDVPAGYISTSEVSEDGATYTVTNTLKWSLSKANMPESGETEKYLAGAEFNLTDNTTEEIIATGVSDENGLITWSPQDGMTEADLNALDGEYTVTETKAPSGYQKLQGVWTLTFDKGVLTKAEASEGYESYISGITKDAETGATVVLKNSELYELPSTGGPGIHLYMLGGVALMMAGTLLVYKKRKEEVLRS